jgi:hypothetical protein
MCMRRMAVMLARHCAGGEGAASESKTAGGTLEGGEAAQVLWAAWLQWWRPKWLAMHSLTDVLEIFGIELGLIRS